MVDAKNTGVPVRMGFLILSFILGRKNHDVAMSWHTWVDWILRPSHIVSCVVDSKDLMPVNSVAGNDNITAIFGSIIQLVAIVLSILKTWEKVVLEAWYKVLAKSENHRKRIYICNLPWQQDPFYSCPPIEPSEPFDNCLLICGGVDLETLPEEFLLLQMELSASSWWLQAVIVACFVCAIDASGVGVEFVLLFPQQTFLYVHVCSLALLADVQAHPE